MPARPEPAVGPPLTARQVWITVTALLIFLIFLVLFAGRNWGSGGGTPPSPPASAPSGGNQAEQPPVLGVMGEAVTVGNTVVGAAFTDTSETFNDKPAEHGQFFAVGIIIGNKGQANFTLDIKSVGLLDRSSGTRYQPMVSAWGTPDDLRNGKYTPTYPLSPQETIAGIIVFDVPKGLAQQRLLVRDLTTGDAAFTGTIDLTKEAQR